ncbi:MULTISPECIES: adenylate/guanylate cyclase domain-containing protein [unclassified Fusibacter]|uniref:adenylate/guanylate cyclase domain-containing protein n=1 Tax=unclassified Fusibacter TaxID=2624464 RepID=UPI0010127534|nr:MULTISPECIES: adenylate/guanylate cyclase domain-containing protein [unclassified Fusibacter]MCK8058512.1 tetratricopeptide repeat protein [Fusibacter sp. A2]NPE22719.1 tetratricopeptide repeat protein [Fusibacter sp. A1]RXV60279.1 hypothetical protein DWB64_12790 [Fusibacter sp. A1]
MKNLVPELIYDEMKCNRYSGVLCGYTMFADISGFTLMTEQLMLNGSEGAEILSIILNKIFDPSIKFIYQKKGFISNFAGDAFTAVFDEREASVINILQSAKEIIALFESIGRQKTRFGEFDLKIKIGLSYGDINWGIISGDTIKSYYFKGDAINNCIEAEQHCMPNDICFDDVFLSKIANQSNVDYQRISKGYYLLNKINDVSNIRYPLLSFNEEETIFFPSSIVNLTIQGEFRKVVSCFISFDENDNIDDFLKVVLDLSIKYGGYFNKIDFGDKGGIVVVIFGAPESKPQFLKKAVMFSSKVIKLPQTNSKIGMSYGVAYAGFVGSNIRQEYTALGVSVNFAARLMTSATSGKIALGESINNEIRHLFETSVQENVIIKGFTNPINIYSIEKSKNNLVNQAPFTSRTHEIKLIKNYIDQSNSANFQGVVHIKGELGIGKSRLVDECIIDYKKSVEILTFVSDELFRSSLNPIKRVLCDYFNINTNNNAFQNTKIFQENYNKLYMIQNANPEELDQHIEFIANIMDLHIPDSILPSMDPKIRFENMMYSFEYFIYLISTERPVILRIEDLQWFDADSIKFLKHAINSCNDSSLIVIITSRIDEDEVFTNTSEWCNNHELIDLKAFTLKETELFLKNTLGCLELPTSTRDTIYAITEGSPFYLEQLIIYLMETGAFEDDLTLKSDNLNLPNSIDSIFLSRIDQLSNYIKSFVKKASILGTIFPIEIISRMRIDGSVNDYLIKGIDENIWVSMDKFKYMFRHTLFRNTVYELQLKSEIRELHKLAAREMITVYKEYLDNKASIIAFHMEKAQQYNEAVKYYVMASNYNFSNYRLDDCINNLDKITELKSYVTKQEMYEVFEKYAEIYYLKVDYEKSIIYCKKALEICESKNQSVKINLKIVRVYNVTNHDKSIEMYEEIESLLDELDDDVKAEFALSRGIILLHSAEYDQADILLDRGLTWAEKTSDIQMRTSIYNYKAYILVARGKYNEAIKMYKEILLTKNEIKDYYGLTNIFLHIGIAYYYLNDYQNCIKYYKKTLENAIKLHDRRSQDAAKINLANVLKDIGQYEKATSYLLPILEHRKKNNDGFVLIYIYNNLGAIYKASGDYINAINALEHSNKFGVEYDHYKATPENNLLLAGIYDDQNRLEEAIEKIEEGLNLAEKHDVSQLSLLKLIEYRVKFKLLSDQQVNQQKIIDSLIDYGEHITDSVLKAYYLKELAFMYKVINKKAFRVTKEKVIRLLEEVYRTIPKKEIIDNINEVSNL